MLINLNIEITPDKIGEALKTDVEDFSAAFMKKFVRAVPIKIRERLDNAAPSGRLYRRSGNADFQRFHQASAQGQTPAKDTGELYRSTKSRMLSEKEGVVELPGHAGFLDPFVGGYLNRPFIELSIDAAFDETAAQI